MCIVHFHVQLFLQENDHLKCSASSGGLLRGVGGLEGLSKKEEPHGPGQQCGDGVGEVGGRGREHRGGKCSWKICNKI